MRKRVMNGVNRGVERLVRLARRHPYRGALVAGISLMWSWLFLIDIARLSSSAVTGYITVMTVFVVNVALSVAAIMVTVRYLRSRGVFERPAAASLILIFAVWALTEFAISWLVSAVWYGPGASADNVLPFSSLTPLLMWTPLKYLTRLLGFYGLSALAVTLVVAAIHRPLRRTLPVMVGLTVALTSGAWLVYRQPTGPAVRVTALSEFLGSPSPIDADSSEIVVLPEYSLDSYSSENVHERFVGGNPLFVGSKQAASGQGLTNRLVFGTPAGFVQEQDKSRLIPGGEYLSYSAVVLLKAFDNNTYTDFLVRRAVDRGNEPLTPYRLREGVVLGSAVCSSIINPEDYRQLVSRGATVLTNSASLEIFNGSRLFGAEHRGLAGFMAVANARPFVQASNNWPAFILDHNGSLLEEAAPTASIRRTVQANTRRTPYNVLGEWPVVTGAAIVAADIVRRLRR